MSLTKNGKRIGRARQAEKQDERDNMHTTTGDILQEIKHRMGGTEKYHQRFDNIYDNYRNSDPERYEAELRDWLIELKQAEQNDKGPYEPRITTGMLSLASDPERVTEAVEMAFNEPDDYRDLIETQEDARQVGLQ